VVTPGFAADCVETLEEIALQGAALFRAHGGENFSLVPCLNDTDASIDMLAHLVRRELQGWI
jgi:ferrochelatase